MQSFIMNSHEVFIHIHQGGFAGTGAIVRLPQCQWSKPDGYGKISQCITTTRHSKARTVCIFLGIYCMAELSVWWIYLCKLFVCARYQSNLENSLFSDNLLLGQPGTSSSVHKLSYGPGYVAACLYLAQINPLELTMCCVSFSGQNMKNQSHAIHSYLKCWYNFCNVALLLFDRGGWFLNAISSFL